MSFHIIPVAEADVLSLVKSIDRVIINPIIFFLFAVAMVYFLYGVAQYFMSSDNEEVRSKSKTHMIWGVVGLFIMVGVFGIMRILLNTFGETRIQVNNNGDFNVSGTNLDDKQVQESPNSGKDLFNESTTLDVSTSTDSPELPLETFITSPFAKYEAKPDMCWNNNNQPFYYKANTEFNAMSQVKANARTAYLAQTGVKSTDKTKEKYPFTYQSQVLYDKKTKTYHAWLDARAPLKSDKTSDCNLKKIADPRAIPDSIVFSQVKATDGEVNLSETIIKTEIKDFTKNPFTAIYKENVMCWHEQLYGNAATEFTALENVKKSAREMYIKQNNLDEKITPENLPTIYASLTAYDKVSKNYYVWQDFRGPTKGKDGKITDCNLLVTGGVETLPIPANQSAKPNPFGNDYQSDGNFYRAIGSGVDLDYAVSRNIAINNALIQIAQMKNLTSISAITNKKIIAEKYYARDAFTGNYDYWVAIESPK